MFENLPTVEVIIELLYDDCKVYKPLLSGNADELTEALDSEIVSDSNPYTPEEEPALEKV